MDLSAYKWKNRLLLIFTPTASEDRYEEQLRMFEGLEADFRDRDLLLGKLPGRGAGELDGAAVTAEEVANLREKFGLDREEFATVLAGKDGTEKYRTEEPVPAEEIFRRIDVMLMRQREMGERR